MVDMIFNVSINIIESFLMAYFCTRYFNIEKNKYAMLVTMTATLTALVTISNMMMIYDNILPIIDMIAIISLLSIFIKNRDIYEKIFVGLFSYLLLHSANSIVILLASLINKMNFEDLINSNFTIRIVIVVMSKILFGAIVIWFSSSKINTTIKIEKKYSVILIIVAIIMLTCYQLLGEIAYTGNVNYLVIYFVMTIFTMMSIIIYYWFILIRRDAEVKLRTEIEITQLKGIESQYIELRALKERNEKIKHDLQYFLDIVNNKQEMVEKDELSNRIEGTIKIIDGGHYQIYCENKVFNSLINAIKSCSGLYNKQVNLIVSLDKYDLPLDTYNVVKEVADFVIEQSRGKVFNMEIRSSNGYCRFKFTYEPKSLDRFSEEIIHLGLKNYEGQINQEIDEKIGIIEITTNI